MLINQSIDRSIESAPREQDTNTCAVFYKQRQSKTVAMSSNVVSICSPNLSGPNDNGTTRLWPDVWLSRMQCMMTAAQKWWPKLQANGSASASLLNKKNKLPCALPQPPSMVAQHLDIWLKHIGPSQWDTRVPIETNWQEITILSEELFQSSADLFLPQWVVRNRKPEIGSHSTNPRTNITNRREHRT